MTNLEIIKKLKESTFTDEDGEKYQLEFQDGLTDSEIEQLKEQFPSNNIDSEIIEILKETKGWDGYGPEMVYFDSIGQFGFWEFIRKLNYSWTRWVWKSLDFGFKRKRKN